MGILDPLRRALQDGDEDDGEQPTGEVSDGGSSFSGSAETAVGGADAVPDTPDGVAEDYT